MCQKRNARIALLRSMFDPRAGMLAIRAPDGSAVRENPLTEAGRARIGAFLAGYLGEEARGEPRFHHVPGHVFCDQRKPVVSLINLASWRDFEARVGARRHRRRFRANVWFSGAPAWAENDWVGRTLQLGGAVLRVTKRIARCPATEVNPLTGERDADPVAELRALYGHVRPGHPCRGDRGRKIRGGGCDRGADGVGGLRRVRRVRGFDEIDRRRVGRGGYRGERDVATAWRLQPHSNSA